MVAYSFKNRFVGPIRVGLGIAESPRDDFPFPGQWRLPDPKRQTIRAERARHARPGEIVQLYCGMRTKQCFKIGEARCVSVDSIVIGVKKKKLEIMRYAPNPISIDAFAKADGFNDLDDMHAFWLKEHGVGMFRGVLIKWEPITGEQHG